MKAIINYWMDKENCSNLLNTHIRTILPNAKIHCEYESEHGFAQIVVIESALRSVEFTQIMNTEFQCVRPSNIQTDDNHWKFVYDPEAYGLSNKQLITGLRACREPQQTDINHLQIIRQMHNVSDAFYAAAVTISNHPFIEFCGLMNEYIDCCANAVKLNIDFTNCSTHTGRDLPMLEHNVTYINTKLECIFTGRSVMTQFDLHKSKPSVIAGNWRKTYRQFLQNTVKYGDTNCWESETQTVNMTMMQCEQMAQAVAASEALTAKNTLNTLFETLRKLCDYGAQTLTLDTLYTEFEACESKKSSCADYVQMQSALEKIARWHGEFPDTNRYWDPKKPQCADNQMSYAACYGTNGERDYMRQVARDALVKI